MAVRIGSLGITLARGPAQVDGVRFEGSLAAGRLRRTRSSIRRRTGRQRDGGLTGPGNRLGTRQHLRDEYDAGGDEHRGTDQAFFDVTFHRCEL